MKVEFSDRVQSLKPSATVRLNDLANELKRKGKDVINFTAGQPDFNLPEAAAVGAIRAIVAGKNKYSPIRGEQELLEALVWHCQEMGITGIDKGNVLVCPGGKLGIFESLLTLINPGDKVLILRPYWVSYPVLVELCGGIPLFLDYIRHEIPHEIDISRVEEVVKREEVKLIIGNSPGNPAGLIFSREQIDELARIAIENNCYFLSDEVYNEIIFEGPWHSFAPKLAEGPNFIILNSASKTYAAPGWRIAHILAHEEIINGIAKLQSQIASGANTPGQYMLKNAMHECGPDVSKMLEDYKQRRDYIRGRFLKIESLDFINPHGAFYIFFKPKGFGICSCFCQEALDKAGLAFVPGQEFGWINWVRLSFAISMQEIKKGMDRLESFLT